MSDANHAALSFTYDNAFVRNLPADPETGVEAGIRPRQVAGACYSLVTPRQTSAPQLIAVSQEMLDALDITSAAAASQAFVDVFTGNTVLEGMQPYAMCYGGHQFGNWAGQLGDGRAINLSEIISAKGERWVLQLKGAGMTPYSRTADGLAVLRSSVREFLCSEAMYHLGIPTTRALSLSLSGDQVMRDMLYDGNPAYEPGAIVCRVAPSFTRFGNFQIFAQRGEIDVLRQLCEHTIATDFPHLIADKQPITIETYVAWFQEVCERTKRMIIDWMRVGFVHGVMNTDNMSIMGLTIDYGPYGWLEDYNPEWTPNTTDAQYHRYAYGSQPDIACWNIAQFANAILPIVDDVDRLQGIINQLMADMNASWKAMMFAKLGIVEPLESDDALLQELMIVLQLTETDYCIFFRLLADIRAELSLDACLAVLKEAYYKPEELTGERDERLRAFIKQYQARVTAQDLDERERRESMNNLNPKYVLRNYLSQQAIDKAVTGDYSMIHELLEVLRQPYTEQPGKEAYAAKRPEWARHKAGCSMLSCSS